jgi:outer membrane lipoprotein-sorting protein
MKKILIVATLMMVSTCSIFAQAGKGLGANDPEAKKLLDAVSAKFKTFSSVKAGFTLRVENAQGKVQGTKTGTVFMKSTKYRVSITGQEIFCDGKTVWNYDKGANEVQVSNVDNSSGAITPQKIFTNFYDKDFLYKLNGDEKIDGKTYTVVELTPVDKSKPFFKVLLGIDKKTSIIMNTRVFEKNGNRYVYAINNISTNAAVTDDTFTFDAKKYPKVEVIDLR